MLRKKGFFCSRLIFENQPKIFRFGNLMRLVGINGKHFEINTLLSSAGKEEGFQIHLHKKKLRQSPIRIDGI